MLQYIRDEILDTFRLMVSLVLCHTGQASQGGLPRPGTKP